MLPPLVHRLLILVWPHRHIPQVAHVPKHFAHRPARWVRKWEEELTGHFPLHHLVCLFRQTPLLSDLRDPKCREVKTAEQKWLGSAFVFHPKNIGRCSRWFCTFFLASKKQFMVI